MRKGMILLWLLIFAVGIGLADTIYLKGGREVQGTFSGFENGQFSITDSDGNLLKFRTERVDRVVIDQDARRRTGDRRTQRGGWERFDAFNVSPANGWVQSPVRVYSGQRLRVEASGTVTLGTRTNVGPEGLSGQRTRYSPMSNQNFGSLIARIGPNSDSPLLYIGQASEIVADRDGILYFAVNSARLANSTGAFVVNVSGSRGLRDSGDDWSGRFREINKTMSVSGNQAWTDTGIDLEPDTTVEITADGQISFDIGAYAAPDGNRNLDRSSYPLRNVGVGALIAKIRYSDGRESSPIFIGSRGQATTRQNESGRLFLGINDDNFNDNGDSYRVTVRNMNRSSRAVARGEKSIVVNANQPWTDSGVDVSPNMSIEIAAEGQIAYSSSSNTGPEGGRNFGISNYPVRNVGPGAVIAKVRYRDGQESSPVFIGSGNQVSTEQNEYGRLFIGINDDNYSDNKGSYRVTIRW